MSVFNLLKGIITRKYTKIEFFWHFSSSRDSLRADNWYFGMNIIVLLSKGATNQSWLFGLMCFICGFIKLLRAFWHMTTLIGVNSKPDRPNRIQ